MSMILKKNQIVTATLLVALCAAVFVNWYYSRPSSVGVSENLGEAEYVNATTSVATTKKANTDSASEYFANADLRRQNAHDKALETINAVVTNKDSSKEAVENASAELKTLSNAIKLEADLENMIKSKLDGKCLVIINSGKAEVIIENDKLNEANITVVKTTVLEQTDITAENIAIVGAK